ncbi:MAG: undecaprenyl-diphosphate phosphatase [Ilumatobacteraceae bacterium]
MPIVHALVLGLVQGFSEFLPISSSGHLLLVPYLFGWNDFNSESTEKAFDVALHIGTVVAAIAYFRRDLAVYLRDGWRAVFDRQHRATTEGRVAWLLLLSTVPAALVGAAFESQIDEQLGTPTIIAVSLILGGLLLALADRATGRRKVENYAVRDALVVGAAQALALNPGTSRSGITITAGRFLGFDRDAAARVSFLMMIPVTLGAVLLKGVGLASDGIPEGLAVPMIVGIVTSGIAGWIAVWGTLRLVRTYSFTPFVIYRVVLGVTVLIVVAAGWRG